MAWNTVTRHVNDACDFLTNSLRKYHLLIQGFVKVGLGAIALQNHDTTQVNECSCVSVYLKLGIHQIEMALLQDGQRHAVSNN